MAFEYLGGGSTDLTNLIFREILKIDPSILFKYTTLQDQVIYLILIPMAILFLFIYAFSRGIVGRVVGGHKGFEYLVSIIVFIYLVYSGIFGTMLVPIFTAWLNIAIVVALIVFVISVVFHPARTPALTKLGREAGRALGKKTFGKQKKIKALEDEIDVLNKQIRSLDHELRDAHGNPRAEAEIRAQKATLKVQKDRLKEEISNLGG